MTEKNYPPNYPDDYHLQDIIEELTERLGEFVEFKRWLVRQKDYPARYWARLRELRTDVIDLMLQRLINEEDDFWYILDVVCNRHKDTLVKVANQGLQDENERFREALELIRDQHKDLFPSPITSPADIASAVLGTKEQV